MSDHAVQANNSSAAAESHQLSTRSEAPLPDATDTGHESHTPPPEQTGHTGRPLAHQDQDETVDTSYNKFPATGPETLLQDAIHATHEPQSPLQRLDPPQAGVPTTSETQEPGPNHAKPIVSEKPATKSETILQDILDTMYESNIFERTRKDAPSRFWFTYERVAKQYDDELIERHSGDLDVLLIFAGLFSAVSSAFIVNMQSSLSPVPSDITNTLLMILINTVNSSTFPMQQASLPVWAGPSSTIVWIQTLAYTSLSSSLLAAFGAVLGKQWLGHFKTSRFGQGALHERCQRRQKKLGALATWHFNTIIATLPILLQMSLLFFGIALAANIWTLQRTVASVIMATTGFGFIFYFFTVVSSLKSPDCPFQTPVSTVLQRVFTFTAPFRTSVAKSWEGILDRLRMFSKYAFSTAKSLILEWVVRFSTCLTPILSTCRQVPLSPADPEAAMGLEQLGATGEQMLFSNQFDFSVLDSHAEFSPVDAVSPHAVQWVLETTTDTEIITAAAGMVPEIEWPAKVEVTGALVERLKSGFYACFDLNDRILPLAQAGAVGCLKAMWRLCVERDLSNPFRIYTDGDVKLGDQTWWHMNPHDPGFLVVSSAVNSSPNHLDMKCLPLSDRMWMAHMFTYRLHTSKDDPEFDTFVIKFIGICLGFGSPLSPRRLVADCVILAGMLVGLGIDRRELARLDKSQAVYRLQEAVVDRTLAVLLDEIQDGRWHEHALKLIHPLLACCDATFSDRRTAERALKFCCYLIDDHSGTLGDDQVRSESVTSLIRILSDNLWDISGVCTQEQFDLLVDYHLRIYQGENDWVIRDTFSLLGWFRRSPSTPDRKRRYVDMLTCIMGQTGPRIIALRALCAIRDTVASMGRDDGSLREQFSQALASAVFLDEPQTRTDDNPFTRFYWLRDIPYIRLLCALSQEPTWHPQLLQNSHFDNCLAIAKTLSSQGGDKFDQYAVPVAHVFAIIDSAGGDHPLSTAVQADLIWPIILRAWRFMFDLRGFGGRCGTVIWEISIEDCHAALPSLVEYARRQWDESEATNRLIELVDKVCSKLDEDPQREWDGTQRIQEDPFWKEVVPVLRKQISELLDASRRDV